MEFGRRVTPPVGAQMISNFLSKSSSSEIDTATMYADTETETILGNVGKEWRKENAKMDRNDEHSGRRITAKNYQAQGRPRKLPTISTNFKLR